jgi:arylsulfatase A-like enzyme
MPESPNVLFVLTDEWRGDVLCCMGDDQVHTPAIDGLAADGVVFENAYTPYPLCTPARGSIQTGCYPLQHRAITNACSKVSLSRDRETIAETLERAGYRTGYVGKWHLSGTIGTESFVPPEERRGYGYWEGFDGGHDHHKGHPRFDSDGTKHVEEGYQPDIQTDLAVDFLEEAAGSDDPFFLFLSWGPPHMPFRAPDEYRAMYDVDDLDLPPNVPTGPDAFDNPYAGPYHDDPRETLAHYYGMITSLDDNVRRLRTALEELGLAEDTLVVFASDHGEQMGSQARWGKNTAYEESIHVPLVAHHPDRIDPGRAMDGLVSLVDLMPTILGYCDVPVPENVQGTGYSAYLTESAGNRDDGTLADSVYVQNGLHYDGWRALRTERYLLAVDSDLSTRHLFDMVADPYQLEDLAGADPDSHDVPLNDLRERLVEAAFRFDDYQFKPRSSFDFDSRAMTFDFGDYAVTYDASDDERLDELQR